MTRFRRRSPCVERRWPLEASRLELATLLGLFSGKSQISMLVSSVHMRGMMADAPCTRVRAWIGRALAVASLVVAITGAGAAQAQDGGSRSVFAFGAGNRALGLGGAFAAIADDASAPLWNPGGLGFVERREIQAASASLYGLDVSEQFVAFAMPSWRWGVGAVAFRRLGVGGIEQRDDRNVLLETDASAEETELMLAYGRSSARGWGLGAALKVHRQSLAGQSGSGLGLDLGALMHPAAVAGWEQAWLSRVSFGVAFRNVVEPSLRLEQDSLSDPLAVRTGLAYHHPLFATGRLLVAFDLEKTQGSDVNPHAGVEFRIHPAIAIRTGWNSDAFTAGAGVTWRDLSLDFVLDNNEIETVHRIGIGMRFGSTTQESRLAARQQAEEEFRQRMEESFRHRQSEQVATLVEEARSMLLDHRYDDALGAVATVFAVDPENPEARDIEIESLRGKATLLESYGDFAEGAVLYGRLLNLAPEDARAADGLERCRRESDLRSARGAEIRRIFATGLDAFAEGDLRKAETVFGDILAIDADDSDARAMLHRTRSAIRSRTQDSLSRAQWFIDLQLFAEADEVLAEVRALNPGAPELPAWERRLEEATAAAARGAGARTDAPAAASGNAASPSPRPAPLTRKQQEEVEALYQRGIDAMNAGRSEEAVRYWELVWAVDRNYRNVADYLKRDYLLRGLEYFSQGTLENAVRLWEKALEVDPTDKRTRGYLDRAREQLARTHELLGPRP